MRSYDTKTNRLACLNTRGPGGSMVPGLDGLPEEAGGCRARGRGGRGAIPGGGPGVAGGSRLRESASRFWPVPRAPFFPGGGPDVRRTADGESRQRLTLNININRWW